MLRSGIVLLTALTQVMTPVFALEDDGFDAATAKHPSLFFDQTDLPAIRARSEALPWLEEAKREIIEKADAYMKVALDPYPLTGPQNSNGLSGRALQNRLGTLAFAGHLTGEDRYLERAGEMLMAVTRQTEPDNKDHWRSHLQQGDAAQAFALGYDWAYPVLSPKEREEVRDELRAFGHALISENTAWGEPSPGVMSCNHNAVHFGPVGLIALILGDEPAWLDRATRQIRGYLEHFADETGYGTEGHHYYGYGLGAAIPFAMALERSGGDDLIAESKTLPMAADQLLWKLLPYDGKVLPLNDNYDRPAEVSAIAGALIANRPEQLWAWLESLEASNQTELLGGFFGGNYTSPFLFLWGDVPVSPKAPTDDAYPLGHRFESGRVFLRSSWAGEDAAHVSMTSGYDFHRGHDHQDENSVTFFANGEGFLIDPDYQLERSDAHTTISIDGAEQIKGGDGRIVAYREEQGGAFVRGQAEEAYDFEDVWTGHNDRKLFFVRGPVPFVIFRDDARVETDRAATYVSRYATYPQNKVEPLPRGAIITGGRAGGKALLTVFSGTNPLPLVEDDLTETSFVRRGTKVRYADYVRRVSATVEAVDPQLVSVLVPFGNETPAVDMRREDEDTLILAVTPEGGKEHRFRLTGRSIVRLP